MAEDPRRTAADCLHQECSRRGYFGAWINQDFPGYNSIRKLVPRETARNTQVASNQKVIVPVTIHIPGPLREFCAGKSEIAIEGSPATLADVLSALWIIFPGLRDRVETETGEIRQHINIFIGEEDIRFTGGLASPVPDGAEISIVPSITGGRRVWQ